MDSKQQLFKLFKHQHLFVHDDHKFSALVGGFGSGKTTAFAVRTLVECGKNPGKRILISEPTYPMVRDVLQPTFEQVLRQSGFGYEYFATEMRYRVKWSTGWADVLMRSAENYQRWAGLNLAAFGIDEADQLRDDGAWKMGISRLRDGNTLRGYISTTPEGFKFVWDYWQNDPRPGYNLTRGKTEDNIMLPEEFITSLKENYDERLLRAYLNGEFVNLQQGQTYNFDRERNVRPTKYDPKLPKHIGMDWNVDPLCSVLWQKYNQKPNIRVFDSISLSHSGEGDLLTERMCETIKQKYPNNDYIAYPDATARARISSARYSDISLVNKANFKVMVKHINPLVVNRVNAMNKALQDNMIIDPSCKDLINDLERVVNKQGTREIDKTGDKSLTHLTDALGYSVEWCYPAVKPQLWSVDR